MGALWISLAPSPFEPSPGRLRFTAVVPIQWSRAACLLSPQLPPRLLSSLLAVQSGEPRKPVLSPARFRQIPNLLGELRSFIKRRGGRKVVDDLFRRLDADGSGRLARDEIRLCLRAALSERLGSNVTRQDERVLCALLDVGREGPMPQDKFEAATKTVRRLVAAVNSANGWPGGAEGGSEAAAAAVAEELRGALAEVAGREAELQEAWAETCPPGAVGLVSLSMPLEVAPSVRPSSGGRGEGSAGPGLLGISRSLWMRDIEQFQIPQSADSSSSSLPVVCEGLQIQQRLLRPPLVSRACGVGRGPAR